MKCINCGHEFYGNNNICSLCGLWHHSFKEWWLEYTNDEDEDEEKKEEE